MTPDELASYAQVMKANGVLKASGEAEEGEDFCIELHPAVFEAREAPVAPATVADVAHADEEEKCACGCLRVEEHNAQGLCIGKGCPVSLCSPEVKPAAVPV